MDKEIWSLLKRVWLNTGKAGFVFSPTILRTSLGDRFSEGKPLRPWGSPPAPVSGADEYWTPAISNEASRKKQNYGPQKVIWVDCDDGYDPHALEDLNPSLIWETSASHVQALWLLDQPLPSWHYSKEGLLGVITRLVAADASGVDIGQLLRVPCSTNYKRQEPYLGRICKKDLTPIPLCTLLSKVASLMGVASSEVARLGDQSPWGDRSRILWRLYGAFKAAGVNIPDTVAVLSESAWNKWHPDRDRLYQDVEKAYAAPHPDSTEPLRDSKRLLHPISDLAEEARRPTEWLWKGIIPRGGCGMIVAPPKVGKTRLSLSLMLSIGSGEPFLGRRVQKGSVLMLSLEDGESLLSHRISRDLNERLPRYHWDGYLTPGLVWNPPQQLAVSYSAQPIDLSNPEDMQWLYASLVQEQFSAVVIDTLGMSVGSADTNSAAEMYPLLTNLKSIAKGTHCAVILIHHSRKSNTHIQNNSYSLQNSILGSTALYAWCDFVLSIVVDKNDSHNLIFQTKQGSGTLPLDSFFSGRGIIEP